MKPISEILGYNHPIFEWPIEGKCYGYSHFKKVVIEKKYDKEKITGCCGKIFEQKVVDKCDAALLDTSTGALYRDKDDNAPVIIVLKCIYSNLGLILNFAGSIAYNLLRVVPLIVYCVGGIFTRYVSRKFEQLKDKSSEEISFKAIAIDQMKLLGTEILRSIVNIVRAPYYALGVFFGQLYGIVDPWNGRKIASSFERAWNHHIDLKHSFWLINHNPGLKLIGDNGHYIAGCFQPVGFMDEHNLISNSRKELTSDREFKSEKPANCCIFHFCT